MDDLGSLLLEATAPVEDLSAERAAVHAGVRRVRRVRRVGTAAALTLVVGVVVGVVTTVDLSTERAPVIGEAPTVTVDPAEVEDARSSLPECVLDDLPDDVLVYLHRWTDGLVEVEGSQRCALRGRLGPVPSFDTALLGLDQTPDPRTRPGQEDLPSLRSMPTHLIDGPPASDYPVVNLGPVAGLIGEQVHATAGWSQTGEGDRIELAAGNPMGIGRTPLDVEAGIGGRSLSGRDGLTPPRFDVPVVTTDDTAVVAVELDGEPAVWQRPVARLAHPHVDLDGSALPGEVVVVLLDVDGIELRRFTIDVRTDMDLGNGDPQTEAYAACVADIDPVIGEYLAEWAREVVPVAGTNTCVLRGRRGPEPVFDTGGLGEPQPVDLDLPMTVDEVPSTADTSFAPRVVDAAAGALPVLDLGLVAVPAGQGGQQPGTRRRLARWFELDGELWFDVVGGSTPGTAPPATPDGILSAGGSRPQYDVTVVTAAETSVVALELDGEPVAWQRPVARLAILDFVTTRSLDDVGDGLVVRELGADGTELAIHRGN